MKVLLVMLRKEFRQFFRNAFLPKLCIMFPLMVMLLMPLVTNMEVRHIGVVMIDRDHSPISRKIADSLQASDYFGLYASATAYDVALDMVAAGDADVIIEIPYGYYKSFLNGSPLPINVSANAVNATKGAMGMQYVQRMLAQELASAFRLADMKSPEFEISILNLFNPTLNYRFFMIPALMIMLLVMLCGFLPALNIVGEKETGTIEQINVSPLSQLTFTLGKIIPYWIIGFVVVTIGILVAWLVYGLTPQGNLLTVYSATGLFILIMSGMAVMFANFSQNMQQVMFIMFFFVMLFILMSGLMTPIQSMPEWARFATYLIPPRYYVDILRATYLRGPSIGAQAFEFLMLSAFALIFILLAIFTYKKQQ